MALAECIVKQGIDDGGIDTKTGSDLPIDFDIQRPAVALLVAGDVGQLRQSLQLPQQNGCPVIGNCSTHTYCHK